MLTVSSNSRSARDQTRFRMEKATTDDVLVVRDSNRKSVVGNLLEVFCSSVLTSSFTDPPPPPMMSLGIASKEVNGACPPAALLAPPVDECCVSTWRRRSTLRWKALEQDRQAKGLKPVCLRLWVMRLEDWLKAFPH